MRVRQDDGREAGCIDRQGLPVALAEWLEALEHATVDQHPPAVELDEIFGTGNRAGSAEESESRNLVTLTESAKLTKRLPQSLNAQANNPTWPPVCQNSTVDRELKRRSLTRAMTAAIAFAV